MTFSTAQFLDQGIWLEKLFIQALNPEYHLAWSFFLKRNMHVECCCYREDYANLSTLLKISKFTENYL